MALQYRWRRWLPLAGGPGVLQSRRLGHCRVLLLLHCHRARLRLHHACPRQVLLLCLLLLLLLLLRLLLLNVDGLQVCFLRISKINLA